MTDDQVRELPPGLYLLDWATPNAGRSLAAVGINSAGARWFAPTNWIGAHSYNWHPVARTLLLLDTPETADRFLADLSELDLLRRIFAGEWLDEHPERAALYRLGAAHEREACARLADDYPVVVHDTAHNLAEIAREIRERGES